MLIDHSKLRSKRWNSIASIVAFCLVLAQVAFGQDDYQGQIRGSSWGSQGDTWYRKETREFDKGVLRLPDEKKLSQLTVEWTEVVIDQLGNFCTVSGRLLTKNETDQPVPIDWQQSIAVHLNKEAGKAVDWSNGVSSESVLSEPATVDRDGKFLATIDLRECDAKFAELRELQAGISLAKQFSPNPDTLATQIESSFPVLKQSIQMLKVPKAKDQPEIIQLINKANGWPDDDSSAVDLIRASNALLKLKRDDAIQAMEEYYKLSTAHEDEFESYVLYGLIQCSFEPADQNEQLPPPKYLRSLDGWRRKGEFLPWPRDPMEISEDIPWLLGNSVALLGVPSDPSTDLVWLRKFGVLRESPLRPADNPLESAERLMNQPRFANLEEHSRNAAISQLKEQSYAMVADVLPPIKKNEWGDIDIEENWEALLKASREIGLFWDEEKQVYRSAKK